jgi:hypothetical protein
VQFAEAIQRQIAESPAPRTQVEIPVPIPEADLGQLTAKAAAQHETLGEYLAKLAK